MPPYGQALAQADAQDQKFSSLLGVQEIAPHHRQHENTQLQGQVNFLEVLHQYVQYRIKLQIIPLQMNVFEIAGEHIASWLQGLIDRST